MRLIALQSVFNILFCTMVWMDDVSLHIKVILTVMAVIELLLFFFVAANSENDILRNNGAVICIGVSVSMTAIVYASKLWTATLTGLIICLLLIIWYMAMAVIASKRGEKK